MVPKVETCKEIRFDSREPSLKGVMFGDFPSTDSPHS